MDPNNDTQYAPVQYVTNLRCKVKDCFALEFMGDMGVLDGANVDANV